MPNVSTLRRSRTQVLALGLLALAVAGSALVGPARADHDGPDTESLTYEPHAGVTPPPRSPGRLAPTTGALMGVHSHDDDDLDPAEQGVWKLEQALGRTMDINNRYYGDFDDFAKEGAMSWLEQWDVDHGRVSLVGWGCTNSDKIINGSLDSIIRRTAQVMKAFGHEFFMRYCWEMDGSRKQGEVKGYKKFVESWRRMYTIFQEEGATNVIWVWTPNAAGFKDKRSFTHNEPPAPYFYPGDEYVDWIAADGYNWGVSDRNQGDRWRHFVEIFDEFMVFARQHPKPIMIGEYGAQEQQKDHAAKQQWMKVSHEALMDKPRTAECPWCGVYSDVAAVVYFDVDYGPHGDWRIMSSPESLAAYKVAADDPWFNQIDTLTTYTPRSNRRPVSAGPAPQSEAPAAPVSDEADPKDAPKPEPEDSQAAPADDSATQPAGGSSAQPASGSSAQPADGSTGTDSAPAEPNDSQTAPHDGTSAEPADDQSQSVDDQAADDQAADDQSADDQGTSDQGTDGDAGEAKASAEADGSKVEADGTKPSDAKAGPDDDTSGGTQQHPSAEPRPSAGSDKKKAEATEPSGSGQRKARRK